MESASIIIANRNYHHSRIRRFSPGRLYTLYEKSLLGRPLGYAVD
jgi:hypothetical protein